ncbi:hypothetical protein SVAN01_01632 [Stagonosporopsis vannaccii]|nr:hypothetical protein SVAN01_01632 [Stagonosporopsis vannaccii]
MRFSIHPVREPSYYFPPALPPSALASPPLIASSEPAQDPLTSTASILTPPHTANATSRARLSHFVLLVKEQRGALIAATWCCIGVAAVSGDPSCLPPLEQLGAGLVGAVCAGGVGCLVIAWDWMDEGLENTWGRVWRWVKDRVFSEVWDEEGDRENEGTVIFDGDGNSVFLLDESEPDLGSERKGPATPMQERDSAGEAGPVDSVLNASTGTNSSRETPGRLPRLKLLSRPLFRTPQTNLSSHHADRGPNIPSADLSTPLPEENHPSGLSGPSPMPSRHAANEWKHFTGQGFWKRQQEIDDVSRMLHAGRARSLDKIQRDVEEMDKKNREKEGL